MKSLLICIQKYNITCNHCHAWKHVTFNVKKTEIVSSRISRLTMKESKNIKVIDFERKRYQRVTRFSGKPVSLFQETSNGKMKYEKNEMKWRGKTEWMEWKRRRAEIDYIQLDSFYQNLLLLNLIALSVLVSVRYISIWYISLIYQFDI